MAEKILITGGTGLVGRHLSQLLAKKGYEVALLGRKEGSVNGFTCYRWDPGTGYIDLQALEGTKMIINLAGALVAKRWTKTYKKEIYDSRILSTRLLVEALKTQNHEVKTLIGTSAIGIYGNKVKGALEDFPVGNTFLANVCADWETENHQAAALGIRTCTMRVGVVLAKEGGFIPEVCAPIKKYVGAVLGTGHQMVSWIHIEDLCRLYIMALENPNMNGVYNAVAPIPVSNKEITYRMANLLGRPILLPPVPGFALRIIFGEMASVLLADQEVSCNKSIQSGFVYHFPDIDKALRNLI